MNEILKKIKKLLEKGNTEEAVKYIDKVLSENKSSSDYIDDLINDLK